MILTTEKRTVLLWACENKAIQLEKLKYFVEEKNIPLTDVSMTGKTVLYYAIENNDLDMIRYVLQKQPSLLFQKLKYPSNYVTIFVAIDKGYFQEIIQCITDEIPSIFAEKDLSGDTVLHKAVRDNVMDASKLRMLIAKTNVSLKEITDKKGNTIAHLAAETGRLHLIECMTPSLLEARNKDGDTAVHLAIKSGNMNVTRCIAEKYPSAVTILDKNNNTILHLAAKKDILKTDDLKLFDKAGAPLLQTDIWGETVAHIAAELGHLGLVQYIVEREPSVLMQKNAAGSTIAMIASENSQLNIVKYVAEKEPSALFGTDCNNNTILHLAVRKCAMNARKLKFLVKKKGVPLVGTNNDGENIVYIAAKQGCKDIICYVAGEQPSILTDAILHAASNHELDVIKLLVNEKSDIFVEILEKLFERLNEEEILDVLKHAPINVNHRNSHNDTVLHITVHAVVKQNKNDSELLKYIVEEKQADIDGLGHGNMTALHCAALHNKTKLCDYLINHGADSNFRAGDGRNYREITQGKTRKTRSAVPSITEGISLPYRTAPAQLGLGTGSLSVVSYSAGSDGTSFNDGCSTRSNLSNLFLIARLLFKNEIYFPPIMEIEQKEMDSIAVDAVAGAHII